MKKGREGGKKMEWWMEREGRWITERRVVGGRRTYGWVRDKWVDKGAMDGWTGNEEQMDRWNTEDGYINERWVGGCCRQTGDGWEMRNRRRVAG